MPFLRKPVRVALMTALLSALCVVGANAAAVGVGTVTADALRLRSEADPEATILATAALDDTVVVLEEVDEDWYRVDYKSIEGYMSAEYLTVEEQAEVELYGFVKSDGVPLNVRTGPSTECEVITHLYPRAVMSISAVDCGWYKITHDDAEGYVSSDYVTICKDADGLRGDGQGLVGAETLGEQIVDYARQYLGRPYVWGGNGPSTFDCSGFTKYVYSHFGYELNRTASAQLQNGRSVSRSELQPGDLIFFNNGKVSTPVSHVGIYVGDGQFIHASTNSYTVQYSSLYTAHYSNTYVYARRII